MPEQTTKVREVAWSELFPWLILMRSVRIALMARVLVLATIGLATLTLTRTSAGRAWRAVCDDPHASAMCGINVPRVFHHSVLAGALAAAFAGIMAAFYLGNMSFGTGLIFQISSAYSRIVRSEENLPVRATLRIAIRVQRSRSP